MQTLDELAALCLQGLLAGGIHATIDLSFRDVSALAFGYADAMLEESKCWDAARNATTGSVGRSTGQSTYDAQGDIAFGIAEAANIADNYSDRMFATYKGRAPETESLKRGDPYVDGLSNGAAEVAELIRGRIKA